jgi:predicted CopG family antitoxin
MKTIQIEQEIYQYLVSKAVEAGEAPAKILRRELHLELPPVTIEIEDDVYTYLVTKVAVLGDSASDILRRELHIDAPPAPQPGHGANVVEFHIPAGTGGNAWNTLDHAVQAKVGDTLRLVNDDSVPHRLHTDGSPFAHAEDSVAPGGSANYLLQSAFDSADHPLYDHNFGQTARFWIRVTTA